MKLKYQAFVFSLLILVMLIIVLAFVFARDPSGGAGLALGLIPGLGLSLVIGTCSAEDYAGASSLTLIPAGSALSLAFASVTWAVVDFLMPSKLFTMLIYAAMNGLFAICFYAMLRKIYGSNISFKYCWPVALACSACALPLMVLPLTPATHGLVTGLWVGCFGLGLARKAGRRSARRKKWLKGIE